MTKNPTFAIFYYLMLLNYFNFYALYRVTLTHLNNQYIAVRPENNSKQFRSCEER